MGGGRSGGGEGGEGGGEGGSMGLLKEGRDPVGHFVLVLVFILMVGRRLQRPALNKVVRSLGE